MPNTPYDWTIGGGGIPTNYADMDTQYNYPSGNNGYSTVGAPSQGYGSPFTPNANTGSWAPSANTKSDPFNPIAGLGSLAETGYGLYQLFQGNNLTNTPRPTRYTDPLVFKNQQLANSIASEGLPDSAKNAYTENINRALGSGINAILEGGGDINMISKLVGGATESYKNLMGEDARQKLANQQVALQANQNVANQNMMNWNWNEANPYLQKLAQGSQETNAGANDIFKGIASAATTLAPLLAAL